MNTVAIHNDDDYESQIEVCRNEVDRYQAEIDLLEKELESTELELDEFGHDKKKYEILSSICSNLEQLREIDGNSLFWDGLVESDQVDSQVDRLRDQASFFERRIKKITDKRQDIVAKIDNGKMQVGFFLDEIETLHHRIDESKNEFIIQREIKPLPYKVMVMPWTNEGKDQKRFRKIMLLALLAMIFFGILIPFITVPIPDRSEVVKIPERLAQLVRKAKPKPKPKPKKEITEKIQDEKKKPTKEERKEARKKVKNKGVLAFKNNFADLFDEDVDKKLGKQANLSNASSTARNTRRNVLTTQAKSSSGGISSSTLSRNVAGTGDQIGAVAFSHVESAIGTAAGEDTPLSSGPGPSRTDEEIQIVFDRYKATLYRIYNRELRKSPGLQGKMVLRMTIMPDGSVSACDVESTDLESKVLLKKIVSRIKKFNFGAKEGVTKISILYPIDFLPSS
jgi:outer membrane biosynthesis protein TonB/flagellar biosynthesis chaperone FliJ